MTAGESGPDYVLFGDDAAPLDAGALLERVAWWAEIFFTPCVAFARSLEGRAARRRRRGFRHARRLRLERSARTRRGGRGRAPRHGGAGRMKLVAKSAATPSASSCWP